MGHDGLSTRAGTIGAEGVAVLGSGETNTIQSLLLLKDTYEWMGHFGDVGYADYVSAAPLKQDCARNIPRCAESRSQGVPRRPRLRDACLAIILLTPSARRLVPQGVDPGLLWYRQLQRAPIEGEERRAL